MSQNELCLTFLLMPWARLLVCVVASGKVSEIVCLFIFPQPFPEVRFLTSPVQEENSESLLIN